jgi:hypothetical protein
MPEAAGRSSFPLIDAFKLELRASSPDGPERSGGGAKHPDEVLGGSYRFLLRVGHFWRAEPGQSSRAQKAISSGRSSSAVKEQPFDTDYPIVRFKL